MRKTLNLTRNLSFSTTKKMATQSIEDILLNLRISVKEQGDLVKKMKADKIDAITIKGAVQELKRRKAELEAKEIELTSDGVKFDRDIFDDACKRRFLFGPSFNIYGGIAGLYDYGPVGCTLKNNILNIWRERFIHEEDMLEIEASMLTPDKVLTASGHKERFLDLMVTDTKTGEFFRADHLFENFLEKLQKSDRYLEMTEAQRKQIDLDYRQADCFSPKELEEKYKEYGIKSPETGNDLNPPIEFNLMFSSNIGPSGHIPAFLRPETAQGIFVNYKRLLDFNNGKLPFGCAQIGHAFRNEISPRMGLLRVREFQMAEIEYFLDPENKNHDRFDEVEYLEVTLFSSKRQVAGQSAVKMTLKQAVEEKMIDNTSLAYFIGKIYLFARDIGLNEQKLRFRQHLENEMAHYACDCWDLEIQCSMGWIEAVGCADRSCYDLECHAKASKVTLNAKRQLNPPQKMNFTNLIPNKKTMGKDFKKEAGVIQNYLAELEAQAARDLYSKLQEEDSVELSINSAPYTLKKEHITKIEEKSKMVHEVDYVPSVIEPSFGIGRIFYCLLEHTFKIRENPEAAGDAKPAEESSSGKKSKKSDKKDNKDEDSKRTYFSLPASVAPYKCSIVPLLGKKEYDPLIKEIARLLRSHNLSHKIDDSRSISIGRRYARTDEIAIPFGITVDGLSVEEAEKDQKSWSITVRERDSMQQIRVPVQKLASVLVRLCNGDAKWEDVYDKEFPKYE